ncbi:hypothetical protein F5B19DRAFT_448597 [Rostrohypoxylon terebratum]|nr:hypothetical protein F5B19DRAFT_448597 [Rostrohypoxylon terebratum]
MLHKTTATYGHILVFYVIAFTASTLTAIGSRSCADLKVPRGSTVQMEQMVGRETLSDASLISYPCTKSKKRIHRQDGDPVNLS